MQHEDFGGLIGVEVELENFPINKGEYEYFDDYWTVDGDGSLRGPARREVKFSNGFNYADAMRAISSFEEVVGDFNPIASPRCSTHVHIGGLTTHRFRKVAILSLLFEPILFALVDDIRAESGFCPPSWTRGLLVYQKANALLHTNINYTEFCTGQTKYSAINFAAYFTHTTIEYRMAPGVVSAADLKYWVNVIVGLVKAAMDEKLTDVVDLGVIYNKYYSFVQDWLGPSGRCPSKTELRDIRHKVATAYKMLVYRGVL